MLVLTRRANQSIMIGHEIVVTVLEVRGDTRRRVLIDRSRRYRRKSVSEGWITRAVVASAAW